MKRTVLYSVLAAVFFSGLFCYARNLSHPFVSQWDEIVHVIVTRNISRNCCLPLLHTANITDSITDWTDSFVWLHKPLLPFYIRAAFFKVFGESLFVFRLPSLMAAMVCSLLLFAAARRLSGEIAASAAVLLFLSNSYVFELVQGRQFSDFSDVLFLLLLTGVLYVLLRPELLQKWGSYIFVGMLFAAAYWCKGGLAFPAAAVFAGAVFWQQRARAVPKIGIAALSGLVLIVPFYWYLYHRFPLQFGYEQHQQILHLFVNVEDWGRPWDFYLTTYANQLFGPLLVGVLAVCIWFSFRAARSRETVILASWVLVYVAGLSFGVSKISNFIVAALPAGVLLVCSAAGRLWDRQHYGRLLALAIVPLAALLLPHAGLLRTADGLWTHTTLWQRFSVLAGSLIVFAVVSVMVRFLPRRFSATAAPVLLACALLAVVFRGAKSNWGSSASLPPDFSQQMALRQTALDLKSRLPDNAVVVVDDSTVVNAFLYFQYWSGGINALPPRDRVFAQAAPAGRFPLFYLSAKKISGRVVAQEPFGYLYKIN